MWSGNQKVKKRHCSKRPDFIRHVLHLLPLSSCCLWLRQSLSIVAISSLCCWMIFFRSPSRSCCCFCRNSCSWGVGEKNSKKPPEDTITQKRQQREGQHSKMSHGKMHLVSTAWNEIISSSQVNHFKFSIQHRALRCHITDWNQRRRHSVIMDGNDPQWRWREGEREVNSSVKIQIQFYVRQHRHWRSHLPETSLHCAWHTEPNYLPIWFFFSIFTHHFKKM